MSFSKKSLYFGVVTYLAAMIGSLLLALIKLDFTGYEIGRLGLFFVLATTGVVMYRFGVGILPHLKQSQSSAS